jgi:cytochrome bd ubiquinol oxidase subunit II
VSFEFREHSHRHKWFWGLAFGWGSLITTVAQGFALGGLLGGLQIENGHFVGSAWGWLNPFSMLVVVGVLFGYVMLGANYLILKTTGEIQQRSYRYSLVASWVTFLISVGVHVSVVLRYPNVVEKWNSVGDAYVMGGLLLASLFSFVMLFVSLWKRYETMPLFWNIAIILFSFTGLSAALYPHMIPNVISSPITVQKAAASPKTLEFMLFAMAVLLPVILTYTVYKYRVFRGKVTVEGYGEHGG